MVTGGAKVKKNRKNLIPLKLEAVNKSITFASIVSVG